MDDAALLDLAIAAAWEAAECILALRQRGFATSLRADQSSVTDADRASEAIILRCLGTATPQLPVIAEESILAGAEATPAPSAWYVDPLDGTRDFAAERDNFCINIGLVRDGRPVLGVIAEPAAARLYVGLVGGFANVIDGAGQRPIRARGVPAAGLRVLASLEPLPDGALTPLLEGRPIASQQTIGSALKFCWLAEGKADLYGRFSRCMEWDTAGPEALLLAAGGRVSGLDGAPLRYGKPGFAHAGFIARGA